MRIWPIDEDEGFFGEKEQQYMFDKIIDKYRDKSAYILVNDSHVPGGAWDTVFRNGEGSGRVIPFDMISHKLR